MIPLGTPCDMDGFHLPNGSNPPPIIMEPSDFPFYPFKNRAEFEFSHFVYTDCQLSAGKVDKLLELLAALYPESPPGIADHRELYRLIDGIKQGDIAWDSFSVQYHGVQPNDGMPRPNLDGPSLRGLVPQPASRARKPTRQRGLQRGDGLCSKVGLL
jgi:hypothetical protein